MAHAHPSLSSLPFLLESQLYSTSHESAYQSRDPDTQQPLLIFVRSYPSESLLQTATFLATQHSRTKDPRLLTYNCHRTAQCDTNKFELALVMEWGEQLLLSDVTSRADSGSPYTEDFLRMALNGLIEGLARLQEGGVAHLNITPRSLFLTASGVKLGPLAPPMLSGQEFYLPPAQRLGRLTPTIPLLENPYKSAVYMLGACFLYMGLLREPRIQAIEELGENIEKELREVPLSMEFTDKLRMMLSVHDSTRPDFRALSTFHLPSLVSSTSSMAASEYQESGCLQCHKDLATAEKRQVLWCDVDNHGFCTWKCAELYIVAATNRFTSDISTVRCKACNSLIEEANLAECVGGQANLTRLREETLYDKPICCECKRLGVEVFQLNCGCYFCAGDLRTLTQGYFKRKVCASCGGELSYSQLREFLYPKRGTK